MTTMASVLRKAEARKVKAEKRYGDAIAKSRKLEAIRDEARQKTINLNRVGFPTPAPLVKKYARALVDVAKAVHVENSARSEMVNACDAVDALKGRS